MNMIKVNKKLISILFCSIVGINLVGCSQSNNKTDVISTEQVNEEETTQEIKTSVTIEETENVIEEKLNSFANTIDQSGNEMTEDLKNKALELWRFISNKEAINGYYITDLPAEAKTRIVDIYGDYYIRMWNKYPNQMAKYDELLTIGSEYVSNGWSKAKEIGNYLKDHAVNKYNELPDSVKEKIGNGTDYIKDKYEDGKDCLKDKWNDYKNNKDDNDVTYIEKDKKVLVKAYKS